MTFNVLGNVSTCAATRRYYDCLFVDNEKNWIYKRVARCTLLPLVCEFRQEEERVGGGSGLLGEVVGVFGGWPFFPKLWELFQISPLDILLDSEKLLGQKLALKVTQAAWTLPGTAAVQRRCWGKCCFVFCFLSPHFLIWKKSMRLALGVWRGSLSSTPILSTLYSICTGKNTWGHSVPHHLSMDCFHCYSVAKVCLCMLYVVKPLSSVPSPHWRYSTLVALMLIFNGWAPFFLVSFFPPLRVNFSTHHVYPTGVQITYWWGVRTCWTVNWSILTFPSCCFLTRKNE